MNSDSIDLTISRITAVGTFSIKSKQPFLNVRGLEKQLIGVRILETADQGSLITLKIKATYDTEIDFTYDVTEVTQKRIQF